VEKESSAAEEAVLTEESEAVGLHYVPQKYLRGFTDLSCPDALWQFDKETLSYSERPASIAKIAQQRSFYDADTERRLNELVVREIACSTNFDLAISSSRTKNVLTYLSTLRRCLRAFHIIAPKARQWFLTFSDRSLLNCANKYVRTHMPDKSRLTQRNNG